MQLTKEEQSIYDGEQGEVLQKAMEILVALGQIYDAEKLIPIKSVQVAGVSYKNLGRPGIEFLEWWVEHGADVKAFSTLNPAGIDLKRWKELGFSEDFSVNQQYIVDLYQKMGIVPTCTCTPYELGNLPKFGDHIGWSESSAVSFANSYIGARTNREGGPSALAAALIGKTPCYGYHLDEERMASSVFIVDAKMTRDSDFGALGVLAGKETKKGIPYFRGLPDMMSYNFKQLGASMAASGSVALYHVDGQTPEARTRNMIAEANEVYAIEDLKDAYAYLNTGSEKIDLVSMGCPHASMEEIMIISQMLKGKSVKVPLWITTSQATACQASSYGYKDVIEGSGAKLITDTCMVVSPIEEFGYDTVATNSAKGCYYMQSWCKVRTRYGGMRQCVDAALTGRWSE
ncbi:MAG: aconitase X catalytic domain-containing protein [Candidatus Methanofastidiosa archaeon]|nr:aconitase X catalytic domain-containing protein [Candidatus Methanofastidiosa archaeon]